jgi:hypothetical protein
MTNKTNKQTTFIDRYEGNFIAKTSPFVNMIFLMVNFIVVVVAWKAQQQIIVSEKIQQF